MTQTTKQTFRAFSFANLASHAILREHDEPWKSAPAVPEQFKTDREAYNRWMADPKTLVPMFSLVEGENASIKVSEANPAHRLWGIVADYDAVLSDSDVTTGLKRLSPSYPPFAWNRTRRGGLRILWKFERPVFVYSKNSYKEFMKRAAKELKLKVAFPGLDEGRVLEDPSQSFVAGADWTVNNDSVILTQTTEMWMIDALARSDDVSSKGVVIPFPVIEAEIHRRFPNRWKAEVQEGARGVRFWDPTADNETAAVLKPNGVVCFTGQVAFASWEMIFGRTFVQSYLESKIGRAVSECMYDGTSFIIPTPDGQWLEMSDRYMSNHLRERYGLNPRIPKGSDTSEVELAMYHIVTRNRIDGRLPFPNCPEEIVEWNGRRFLNDSKVRAIMPALDPQEWGVNFPWIAEFLENFMADRKNLEMLLSEMNVWMRAIHTGQRQQGHVVFLAGAPGVGKTLFMRRILGAMVGGYAPVTKFFVGDSKYNSVIFEAPLWCIDDAAPVSSGTARKAFSNLVKEIGANGTFQYERKYGYSGEIPFSGRLYISLNMDATSLSILPDMSGSVSDKVTFLRTGEKKPNLKGTEAERVALIDQELPFFARWVLDMSLPDWVKPETRFGIEAWHDPAVATEAWADSTASEIEATIESWASGHTPADKDGYFEGSASFLLATIKASDDRYRSMMQELSARWFGRELANMVQAGVVPISQRVLKGHRIYRVPCGSKYLSEKAKIAPQR